MNQMQHKMQSGTQRSLRTVGVVSALALVLSLAACNRPGDGTVGQSVDSAMNRTEQAAANTKREAGAMADKVEAKVDDMTITASVSAGLAKDPDLSAVKIDVDTHSGVVTMSGPAPTPAAKDRATTIAQNVKGVAGVNNKLEVRAG